jgi:purine-binding chemotaxis protein CheW
MATRKRSTTSPANRGRPEAGTPDPETGTPETGTPEAVTPEAVTPEAVTPEPGGDVGTDDAAGTADFVTFVIDDERYAFPMEQVEEIIRMPQTVRVPLGPASLTGLANLRGRILPIVDLRTCCGLPTVEPDDATRVIVVDAGKALGFVVDRVASVTSVDLARVEPAEQVRATVDSDLLTGVIRAADGAAAEDADLTKVLDVVRLVRTQFAAFGERVVAEGPTGPGTDPFGVGQAGTGQDGAVDADDDTLEMVSFVVDGQEYALPIDLVQEIVHVPERVTRVPNAEPRVLGLMDLRGRLLPVISLRQVFGLDVLPLEEQNRIVVVQVPAADGADGDGRGTLVGMVMDTVREVLRVPQGLVAGLPGFMARSGRAREVEAVCRLEDGARLVSVISVQRMFERDDLRTAVRDATGPDGETDLTVTEGADEMARDAGRTPDDANPGDGTADGDDELLVVFRLAAEEYSVDVDTVQEIIRVPDSLIRVPKALDFVEGLVNLRGAVLPVVDLRTRLGLDRVERDEQQRIVVLIVNGVRTGFIVDSVTEVLPVTRGLIEPAPELSAEQALLVRQVANLAEQGRMLMLLEPDQLLANDQLAALVPHQRGAAELVG